MLTKGREIKIRAAAVGDIAFYGRSRSDVGHVTVYVGNGRCVSHGQESGPMLYPLDYDRAAPAACSWSRPT
jgi:cell wall-associated NlpC family hydrolase